MRNSRSEGRGLVVGWRLGKYLVMAVTCCFLATTTIGTGTAAAVACSESHHCYAIANWTYGPLMGNVSGHLNTSEDGNVAGSRSNQEAWVDTTGDGSFDYFIEQGLHWGPESTGYNYYGWFWEDLPSNDINPVFHSTTLSYNFGTDYPWGFHYHGGNVWQLQRSDVGTYATASDPGPTTAAQAGAEFTSASDSSCGYQDSLAYQLSGTYTQHFGWYTSTSHAAAVPVSPPATDTFTSYENLTWHLNC